MNKLRPKKPSIDLDKDIDEDLSKEGGNNERSLVDDEEDCLNAAALGSLSFSGSFSDGYAYGEGVSSGKGEPSVPFQGESLSPSIEEAPTEAGPYGITFEVVSAEIVKGGGKSKHVEYTIVIRSTSSFDGKGISIKRRYTDFEKLHVLLKKQFPHQMEDIMFPKKVLTGNFKAETIATRSRAFEQYLMHIFTIHTIRISNTFLDFFFGDNFHSAYQHLLKGEYQEAIPKLQSALKIQKKLMGNSSQQVVLSLSAIVACCCMLEKDMQAQLYADVTLQSIGDNRQFDDLLIPLLQLSIRLCWKLGKDKKDLEVQLQELKRVHGSDKVDGGASLCQAVLQRWTPLEDARS